jgi:hypothetical protein
MLRRILGTLLTTSTALAHPRELDSTCCSGALTHDVPAPAISRSSLLSRGRQWLFGASNNLENVRVWPRAFVRSADTSGEFPPAPIFSGTVAVFP